GLFFLATVLTYLHRHEPGRARRPRWWTPLALYVASLLAKPVGMSLPLVLVVLDVYPLRRLPGDPRGWWSRAPRALWIEKVPYVVLGVATAIVEAIAEQRLDTFYSLAQYGIAGRLGQVFWALGFYLWKTLVPLGLSPLYQLPVGWTLIRADVLLAAVAVVGLAAGLVALRRRWPAGLAAFVAYVVLLLPVLGIAQAGPHIAADRYTYLATMSWAALAGGVVFAVLTRMPRDVGRVAIMGGAVVVAVGLGVLTVRQGPIWHDSLA